MVPPPGAGARAGRDPGRRDPAPGGPGGVLGAAGGVAGLTLASRALGFLRWVVQASTVGAGTVAGAYATANQVPNVLYEVVVGGALAATVVPLLAPATSAGRRRQAQETASGLLGVVLLVLLPLGAGLALLADPVARLFPVSQGADAATQVGLVASFLRMFALQVPLYGVGVVLTGVLQAHRRFTWPALTPVLSSLVVMATYGVYGAMAHGSQTPGPAALRVLGWGTTAGVAALSLPLVWPVTRLGIRLRPVPRLDRAVAGRALRLGGAGVVTLVAQQVSVLVVLALARWGGSTGTVAVYQYTQAVYVLPYAVLVVPVATVLYPRLAAAFGSPAGRDTTGSAGAGDTGDAGDTGGAGGRGGGPGGPRESVGPGAPGRGPAPSPGARDLAARSTGAVTAVAVAGAGALLAVSAGAERLFSLLADVTGMGAALVAMAPGLVGYALVYQVTRVLFAMDRSTGAAVVTAVGWLVVAGGSWAGVGALSDGGDGAATLLGVGLGQSTGMVVAGAGLLAVLARALGGGVLGPSLRALAVGAPVAAAVGWSVCWLTNALGSGPGAGSALLGAGAAAAGALGAAGVTLGAVNLCDPTVLGLLTRRGRTGTGASPGGRAGGAEDEQVAGKEQP
ncbi:lipid II flippase MurJ [uncultured Actinomyces sp.]|uniref:murein biosynthesis integral membrane protein MurJ n=1 Tax=uncultured Actinomyces sp. TaxID=249061 RepID=UPI0028EA257D|nr:lipid II flippase MurJ [uncultured Actinomyces sp.]